jgi:hypothetical protein
VQGAVLAPTSGDPANLFDTGVDPAEQTRRPYLQGRVRASWGSDVARGEIGVGIHRGWFRRADGVRLASEGVAVDATIPFGSIVEVRAEAYEGKGLRGLGGAGIGQLVTTDGTAVEDRGGWVQLNLRPSSLLELGGGCGVGDPDDAGLPAGRLRNVSCEGHLITHPGGPVVAGVEFRRLRTTYSSGPVHNNHVNLAVGFEF